MRLYQTDEEFAARKKQVEVGVQRGENATGSFRNDFATRAFRQTSLIVDPPDGRMPMTTAEAEKRRASRDRGTFGDGPFNAFEGLHPLRSLHHPWHRRFHARHLRERQPNRAEPGRRGLQLRDDSRYASHLHRRSAAYRPVRSTVLSDSRGHWEGDVLVVETTNLTDKTSIGGNRNGLRHSAKMKITEQFKRVADDVVQCSSRWTIPSAYARPFSMSMPLTPLSGGVLLPYECHEGNLAVRNALELERAEDRALAEDLAKGIQRPRRGVQEAVWAEAIEAVAMRRRPPWWPRWTRRHLKTPTSW